MNATTTLPTETLAFPCPATITKEDLEQTLTLRGKLEFVRSFNNVANVTAELSGKVIRFEATQAVAARIARAGFNVYRIVGEHSQYVARRAYNQFTVEGL